MKRKWLWLAGPWALFVVLALGWTAYWHIVAGAAEERLHAFAAAQQAQGASAGLGRIQRRGFPVLLRLELHDLSYAPARAGWRVAAARADLHVNLRNTAHVTFEARSPITITRTDGAVTAIAADTLIASWRMNGGVLAQAGIEADNLSFDDPAREGVLRAGKAVINLRPDTRAAGAYQLSFDAESLALPRPVRSFESFGTDVASLRAAIVIEHGAALLQSGPRDPLGPWREAGGKLRFEALELNWGPLATVGSGEGGLDNERRLQGALHFPIERPAPVLRALAEGADQNASQALRLLAAGYSISGEDITIDAEAGVGVLRLEGLRVRTLPPVY